MLQNFRCKNGKDIETAAETLISNSSFKNIIQDAGRSTPKLTVTYQREDSESFDSYIDKKK